MATHNSQSSTSPPTATTSTPPLQLTLLPRRYAICRWPASARLPDWVWVDALARSSSDALVSFTRTIDEFSLVCPQDWLSSSSISARDAPERVEADWRSLRVVGPLDFALVGVLARLTAPLAEAGVSLFALSTYDTDYLLVKADKLDIALAALATVAAVES